VRHKILVQGAHLERLRGDWASQYEVHLLRDFPDTASFLAGPGQVIEVIVSDGGPIPAPLLREMPALRLVACFSTGYADINVPLLRARGVRLTTAGGVNAHDVADHAVALMLAGWHGIVPADADVRAGKWRTARAPRRSLRDRKAGIVGLGRIGSAIAERLVPMGLSIAWYGPNAKPDVPYPRAAGIHALAESSDILIVASRATQENRLQIDRSVLHALGPEGLIVNVSRGLLVDEDALIDCLKEGHLGGAALDVFADEPPSAERWREVPNVVLSPHIAGYTQEAGPAMMSLLAENVRRYFAGEPLLTPAW
jgi:lactate dehydrogenase-like 2-hydroxyacid dehydrogenase